MAANDCIEEIKKAAGRDLTDDQIDDLITNLRERAKERKAANDAESAAEAITKAADEYAEELLTAKLIERRNAYLNWRKRTEALEFVRNNFGDNLALGVEALLVGVNRLRRGARLSVSAEQRGLVGKYTQGFIADVETKGFWRNLVSGQHDRQIAQELWEIRDGGNPGVSRDKIAQEIAQIIHKWQEVTRTEANHAGAWIKRSPGYIVRQSHDHFKIRATEFEEWRDFVLPLLDTGRTFADVPPEKRAEFLKNIHAAFASGIHLSNTVDNAPTGFKGFANLAKRMSEDRVIHFKDADSWFEYNTKFGTGSIREALLFGFDRMGRQTGLMRVMGPNPESNFSQIMRGIEATEKRNPKSKFRTSGAAARLSNQFAEVDGSVNIPANMMLARVSAVARAVQTMSKLGGATLSAISDIPLAASELRYQGNSFFGAYANTMTAPLRGLGSKQQKEILGSLGIVMDSMAGNIVYRFSGHDDLPGRTSRLVRTFFKFNGLTWWTDSMRSSVGLMMANQLALARKSAWADVNPDTKRALSLFGIADEADWKLLQKATTKAADGNEYMTPDGVRDLSDDDIRGVIGADASINKVNDYRDGLESRLRSYFRDRVDYAVIHPDARVNAMMKQGLQPGTVLGETLRFVMQFKSFPMAVITKSLGREVYGRGSDTLGQAGKNFLAGMLGKGNGEFLGLAHLIVMTSLFGYLAMTAKDLAKGRTPRDPADRRTWFAAMTQGGGAGLIGDVVFGDMRTRYGNSALSVLAGPTAGTAEDLFDIWARVRDGDDAMAQTFTTIINNTPFINLFYTRMALDYLVLYQLREMMNPGYLRRMEGLIEDANEQTFLIRPSRAIPAGGGNRIFEGVR